MENFKISSNFRPLQRMSRMTKHVSKAGKVDPGDMVTLPVKITCESELTLTRLQGQPSLLVNKTSVLLVFQSSSLSVILPFCF